MEGSNSSGVANGEHVNLVTPSIPTKTPVSLLQELAAKQGITPKYDLLQVEGAVHEPTFLYRATVGEFVASGQGQSKKKAKHTAARAVLDQMLGQPAPAVSPLARPEPMLAELPSQLMLPYDDGIPGNPVGQLQELCMSRRWPPPTYELVHEEGLPHERTFTIACCIGAKAKEIGVGKSKKIAKRQASSLMLTKLRDTLPADGVSILDNDDDELGAEGGAAERGQGEPAAQQPQDVDGAADHRTEGACCRQLVSQLQNLSLNSGTVNFVKHLRELAQEQNFEITWVDIDEKTTEGRYHCLIQLNLSPVVICYGTGDDPTQARSDAAHNALEYLKIMVKK